MIVNNVEEAAIVVVPVIELFGTAHQEDIVLVSRLGLEGAVQDVGVLANMMLREKLSDLAGELPDVSLHRIKNDDILL